MIFAIKMKPGELLYSTRFSEIANDIRYKNEARRIAVLNEIFGDVELSTEEMRTMVWLAGWEDSTVENVVSAIRKAMASDVRRRELPLRP